MRKFEANRSIEYRQNRSRGSGYLLAGCRPIEMLRFDEAVYKFACNLAGLPVTHEKRRRLMINLDRRSL